MSDLSIFHWIDDDFQKHERKPTKMWTSWKNKSQPRKDPKNVTSDGHKWPLLESQIEESFQKIFCRKNPILRKKNQKNLKSKNNLKSPLRALNKKLWVI